MRHAMLLGVLLLAGCGSHLPETVPVSGRVTMAGGPLPAPGAIMFQPLEAAPGFALRPAAATLDADGRYQARAFTDADGLVPGKYEVRFSCWKAPPNEADGEAGESYVPDDFVAHLDVPVGGEPIVADFDIPRGQGP